MSRARHVTPGRTVERLSNIRKLIVSLQDGQLTRDEIGALLKVGPSGVRKYLADLRGKVELSRDCDEQVCRLVMSSVEVEKYFATLAAQVIARPVKKSAAAMAMEGAGRHFHILADDEYYAVRVSRAPIARDWCVAALFGAGPARMEARA